MESDRERKERLLDFWATAYKLFAGVLGAGLVAVSFVISNYFLVIFNLGMIWLGFYYTDKTVINLKQKWEEEDNGN